MIGQAVGWLRTAYRGEQQIDFPSLWRRALLGSLAAVVVSLGSFVVRGVDLGIEFEGGHILGGPRAGTVGGGGA